MATLPGSARRAAISATARVKSEAAAWFVGAGGQASDDPAVNAADWRAWRKEYAEAIIAGLQDWAGS